MDWGIIGTISGILAILGVVYTIGRYAGKIDDLCGKKDEINAAIIKVDTLWKIYMEDIAIRHSNPGSNIVLPDPIKVEIRTLINNDKCVWKVKDPTLLIIDKIGLDKFSKLARENKADLGQVLATVNSFIFDCLTRGPKP